ncbi:hypothetical protein CC78DRAFT_549061 [Lojkania enalia]|uniref:Uncharacterized protein n=1 Tax=Lojkania enalia TaxID=147567 RepID=A0A9P4JWL7_9PLEO|nr:hypothetical protein CC78DRAFT_549061 [Didymosphaeria enalia]
MSEQNNLRARGSLHPAPRRSQNVFQRIVSFMSSFPSRKYTPKFRTKSAPVFMIHDASQQDDEDLLPSKIEIPTMLDDPYPYDTNIYHSSPSVENKRPSSLILRGFCSQISLRTSRSGSSKNGDQPCSHTNHVYRHLTTDRRASTRNYAPTCSPLYTVTQAPSVVLDAQHEINTTARTNKEVSFGRLPALNTLTPSPSRSKPTCDAPIPESEGLNFEKIRARLSPGTSSTATRSTSPKIHHIHGLGRSQDHPYVHRKAANEYIAEEYAAGNSFQEPMVVPGSKTNKKMEGAARFAETVFYGSEFRVGSTDTRAPRSASGQASSTAGDWQRERERGMDPLRGSPTQHSVSIRLDNNSPVYVSQPLFCEEEDKGYMEVVRTGGRVTVDDNEKSVDVDLVMEAGDLRRLGRAVGAGTYRRGSTGYAAGSRYRERGFRNAAEEMRWEGVRRTVTTISLESLSSCSEETVGSSNLKDGSSGTPRLRGGAEIELEGLINEPRIGSERQIKGYLVKRFLLTCGGICWGKQTLTTLGTDTTSQAPTHLSRPISRLIIVRAPRRILNPQLNSLYTPTLRGGAGSSSGDNNGRHGSHSGSGTGSQRTDNSSSSTTTITSNTTSHSSSNTHTATTANDRDEERVLGMLYRLAGGTGKPVTRRQWACTKPKKRIGGLLGLVMYGDKVGTAYEWDGEKSGRERGESSKGGEQKGGEERRSKRESRRNDDGRSGDATNKQDAGRAR